MLLSAKNALEFQKCCCVEFQPFYVCKLFAYRMTVASFEKATAFITDARLYPKSVFLKHMCLTRVSSLAEDVQMYL